MRMHVVHTEGREKLQRGGVYETRSRPVYRGVCRCGWIGEERDTEHRADVDGDDHILASVSNDLER